MKPPLFRRLALIGLGLMGGSIARAARRHGLAGEIVGHAKSAQTLAVVGELGFCDRLSQSAEGAVEGADLVILCVPVGATGEVMRRIAPALEKGTLLSEVGSIKRHVIDAIAPLLPDSVHFIPTHPIAGTEHSGPRAGFESIFSGRWCIFTPSEGTDARMIARLRAFWQAMGAHVEMMSAQRHDRVLAITSHVPHLVAYSIVGAAIHLETVDEEDVIRYSASGFRDFTRIAASDPTMWSDVFAFNRDAVLEMLGRFTEDLLALQRAVRGGDRAMLFEYFTRTRAVRRSIIEAGQDTAMPDFGRMGSAGVGDTEAGKAGMPDGHAAPERAEREKHP